MAAAVMKHKFILRGREAGCSMAAIAMLMFATPAPLRAQANQSTQINGRCQYSDQVARYQYETALILCDAASITLSPFDARIAFTKRSWGLMVEFSGPLSANKMAVERVTLRNGRTVKAAGACEIFHHDNGHISVISCLAKSRSGSVAANFVPSHL